MLIRRTRSGWTGMLAVVMFGATAVVALAQAMPPPIQTTRPKPSPAAPSTALLVVPDANCTVTVDGRPIGQVAAHGTRRVAVSLGQHLVAAVHADGRRWQKVVEATTAGQQVVVEVKFSEAEAAPSRSPSVPTPGAAPVPSPRPPSGLTVDDVVARYLQALGGVERIKAVQSVRLTGTLAQVGGDASATGSIVFELKRPSMRRVTLTSQGTTMVWAYDGGRAWQINPASGSTAPTLVTGKEALAMENAADFEDALLDYRAKGHQVELIGRQPVAGRETYKLKVTHKNGQVTYRYIDAERFLEGRQEADGTANESTDYRDVGGLMIAHTFDDGQFKVSIKNVELDVPIDDARFRMPEPAGFSGATVAPTGAAMGQVKGSGNVTGTGSLVCSKAKGFGTLSGQLQLAGTINVTAAGGGTGSAAVGGTLNVAGTCSNGWGAGVGSGMVSGLASVNAGGASRTTPVSGWVRITVSGSGFTVVNPVVTVTGQ